MVNMPKQDPKEPDHRDPRQVEQDLNEERITTHKRGERAPYKPRHKGDK